MSTLKWELIDNIEHFNLGESGAKPKVFCGREALYFEELHTNPVLLSDDINMNCYRLEAEVAFPESIGFAGLVFGARDSKNYELVYITPGNNTTMGEIQYDPIMKGSSTWQIYHGSSYQAPALVPIGKWIKLSLEVQLNSASVYVGDSTSPQLVIRNLQLGSSVGKIGIWGNLPCYISNFSVKKIDPISIKNRLQSDFQKLAYDTFITEWMISKPYLYQDPPLIHKDWIKATVEENGILNLNRLYTLTEKDTAVQLQCIFSLSENVDTNLLLGYSDKIRLWINNVEVYQGECLWNPPESDGRIRSDHVAIPIRWRKGVNTIRAEIINHECMFGWGLSIKTGIYKLW
ncbi:hypothetical protein [Chengkuizengella sediminis]|uniref:hypothetical protein n=1 Tax=Chengkuizengella sediminis TaxID=1885917 RepID=UPI00138A0515|nr:hypothetical protein [Chengkuizengella sediminis]NDI33162.1 hypothetical protein [Chengkuizengella sediminis]